MKKLLLLVAFAGIAQAQSYPWIQFLNSAGTHNVRLMADPSQGTNIVTYLPTTAGTNGYCLKTDGAAPAHTSWLACVNGLTSVGLAITPTWLTVSGSPLTANGTMTVTATSGLTANQFLGTPNGSTGVLSPRSIVANDIPATLNATTFPAATVNNTSSSSNLALNANSGQNRNINMLSANVLRWTTGMDGADNWSVNRFNSSASYIDTPISVNLAAGSLALNATTFPAATVSTTSSPAILTLNANSGQFRNVNMTSAGVLRWSTGMGTGDSWSLNRFDGSGTLIDSPLAVDKTTGTIGPSSGLWYVSPAGLSFAQNVTARYVINSAADTPATGSFTASGSTISATLPAQFDGSWVGGDILLCTTTCAPGNASTFPITGCVGGTNAVPCSLPVQLTLGSSPGFNGSFFEQTNAYQTRGGTMGITGPGYGAFQGLAVTNTFASIGISGYTGVVSVASHVVSWSSGHQFDRTMLGGSIIIGFSSFAIDGFVSPTQLHTSSAASGSGSYSYVPDAFKLFDGTSSVLARIDKLGNISGFSVTDQGGGAAFTTIQDLGLLSAGVVHTDASGFFSTSAVNAASEITGNLGVSHLNSGASASSSTFWRGDGIWAAASGGGVTTTAPVTGTTTIGCATCVRTSGSVGYASGSAQFSSGLRTVATGLSAVTQCTANIVYAGAGGSTETVNIRGSSGGSQDFGSSTGAGTNFFTYACTGTP